MNIETVVESKNVRQYFVNLFKLMGEYTGNNNVPDIVDHLTGEIIVWEHKDVYCSNYALIQLVEHGDLTPTNKIVKERLYENALSNYSAFVDYTGCTFYVGSYSSEVDYNTITAGLIVKKVKRIIKL